MSELGVTSETILNAMDALPPQSRSRNPFTELSDEEWSTIVPLMPTEPRQSNAIGNREFVNAVLAAMHRGGRWNDYRKNGPYPDAIRRRFGRWAHLSRWQALFDAITNTDLTDERKNQLKAISERAERLREKN